MLNDQCGDQPILRIEIYEYIQLIAGFELRRDITMREQDLSQFLTIHVKAGRRISHHLQRVLSPNRRHAQTYRFGLILWSQETSSRYALGNHATDGQEYREKRVRNLYRERYKRIQMRQSNWSGGPPTRGRVR